MAGWVQITAPLFFVVPPKKCGGAGFPSSTRGFSPPDTPRIEVYYGFVVEEASRPRCRAVGAIYIAGQRRMLCRGRTGRLTTLETSARYDAGDTAEVSLRLVTT